MSINLTGSADTQATVVEQSRAVAEVLAAFERAVRVPRDERSAFGRMRQACQRPGVADVAAYSYKRAGQTVTGPSIRLAETLAACWGNVDYGTRVLSKDEFLGTSELLAWAIDLETNTRSSQTIIVPNKSISNGRELVGFRDERENTANVGSRILRECILRILPSDFVTEAVAACADTVSRPQPTAGRPASAPLAQRAAGAVAALEAHVSRDRIVAKHGDPAAWTEQTLSAARADWTAITNDADPGDVFPAVDETGGL